MPVELRNAQRQVRLDARRLERVAERLLKAMKREQCNLSILLTDDRRMAEIHGLWMGDFKPTDVLSFPSDPFDSIGIPRVLGDVVISVETASRRAPDRVMEETTRCLIHGLLHLIGYDHATQLQQQRMWRKARLLQRLAREGT